jgi:hypothetical protein
MTPPSSSGHQRRSDHHDRVRTPSQAAHWQQDVRCSAARTPRTPGPQPPPNQTITAHDPRPTVPPGRQPVTTTRAAQHRRGQPHLDPGLIAAYREHGDSARHERPSRRLWQDDPEGHPPTGTSSPRRRTPTPATPPSNNPVVITAYDADHPSVLMRNDAQHLVARAGLPIALIDWEFAGAR